MKSYSVFARSYHGLASWRAGGVIRQTKPLSYEVNVGNQLVHKHVDKINERRTNPIARTLNEELAEEDLLAIKEFGRIDCKTPTKIVPPVQPDTNIDLAAEDELKMQETPVSTPEKPNTPKPDEQVNIGKEPALTKDAVLQHRMLRSRGKLKPSRRFDDDIGGLGQTTTLNE